MPKGIKLSKKQKGFVKDWVKTGNGTEAAMKNYKVKNKKVAGVIAAQNLKKLSIQAEITRIGDMFPDAMLAEKHQKLLNQKQVAYFVFPKYMDDEEITEKVNSAGFEVIVIRFGEKGKYAFYSNDDATSVSKGLDMAYKLKGSYAAEKKAIEVDEELLEIIKKRASSILE